MKKTKFKKSVVAVCMALAVLCCTFIPVKKTEAAGGWMDFNTVCSQCMVYDNCSKMAKSAADQNNDQQWSKESYFAYCINMLYYYYYKDLAGCYFFTALAMQSSGCSVVAIDYTDGFGCVAHWNAYAFNGWRAWQNICHK